MVSHPKNDTYSKQNKSYSFPAQLESEYLSQTFGGKAKLKRIPNFFVSVHDCSEENIIIFSDTRGVIRGFTDRDNVTSMFSTCRFQVTVPQNMYVIAYSELLGTDGKHCKAKMGSLEAYGTNEFSYFTSLGVWSCTGNIKHIRSPLLFGFGNELFIKYTALLKMNTADMLPNFWLHFESTPENLRKSFNVVRHSDSCGHITLHGFDQNLASIRGSNISYILHLPPSHVLMLSFPLFRLSSQQYYLNGECIGDFLELLSVTTEGHKTLWIKCDAADIEATTLRTSVAFRFQSEQTRPQMIGFKALFSFHPSAEAPYKVSSGLFNCSRHYRTFRHHLDCNLRVECLHQEDEIGACPFSSSHCKGQIYLKVSLQWISNIDAFRYQDKLCPVT